MKLGLFSCQFRKKKWKCDPCLHQFLHWIRGHRYTRRLILRPISAKSPRIDLCTKTPPVCDTGKLVPYAVFKWSNSEVVKWAVLTCTLPSDALLLSSPVTKLRKWNCAKWIIAIAKLCQTHLEIEMSGKKHLKFILIGSGLIHGALMKPSFLLWSMLK